jgi:BioD-like phosphotransacetylase family protein
MTPKILNSDGNYDEWCEEEIIKSYKDAAEYDDVLLPRKRTVGN